MDVELGGGLRPPSDDPRTPAGVLGPASPQDRTAPAKPALEAANRTREPLLSVRNLKTYFAQDEGTVLAVDGVSFDVAPGATLGIVGRSGAGKSVTARSILRIVDRPGRIIGGEILFRRPSTEATVDLAKLDPNGAEMRAIRGAEIALIFQ